MDEGAVASWPQRLEPGQLSAIQYAMDVWAEDERVFYAEFQNEPLDDAVGTIVSLDPSKLLERRTMPRGTVPDGAKWLTAFIDVQGNSLWWLVSAWTEAMKGHIVDYGVWPQQGSGYQSLKDIRVGLQDVYKLNLEESLLAGLTDLSGKLLLRQWPSQTGSTRLIDSLAIDANWNVSTNVVYSVARQLGGGKVLPWHGRGIGASAAPMASYRCETGDKKGTNWIVQKGRKKQRHLIADVNYWKSFLASLATSEALGLTLPECGMDLADQLCSEYAMEVVANGRTVHEWTLRPGRDNHWLDGLVGCAVQASVLGGIMPGQHQGQRKRIKASEVQRRKLEVRKP